jgi:hypothetical protein
VGYYYYLNDQYFTANGIDPVDAMYYKNAQQTVANLISSGWTVLGSSRAADYSATPDGVDRWAGSDYEAVLGPGGGGQAWFALQSPAGFQVVILAHGGGGNSRNAHYISMNGFASGGVWRSSPVNQATRPQDLLSLPDSGREIGVEFTIRSPQSITVGAVRHFVVRDDGKGYIWVGRVSTDTPTDYQVGDFLALVHITQPVAGDTNPYLIHNAVSFDAFQSAAEPSSEQYPFFGRIGANVIKHGIVILGPATTSTFLEDAPQGPEPFDNVDLVFPFAVYSNQLGGLVRWAVSDLMVVRRYNTDSSQVAFGTSWNNGALKSAGTWALPWHAPGAPGGTARVLPLIAIEAPSGSGSSAAQSFNLGLETS